MTNEITFNHLIVAQRINEVEWLIYAMLGLHSFAGSMPARWLEPIDGVAKPVSPNIVCEVGKRKALKGAGKHHSDRK